MMCFCVSQRVYLCVKVVKTCQTRRVVYGRSPRVLLPMLLDLVDPKVLFTFASLLADITLQYLIHFVSRGRRLLAQMAALKR